MADIFVSRPTDLADEFEAAHVEFEAFLRTNTFETKTLGRNVYSLESPLDAVINLMKSCSGAVILGYPQRIFTTRMAKCTRVEFDKSVSLPTPWNQIESVLAYQLNIPILVIAHTGISGGIFDHGVTGKFIFSANLDNLQWFREKDKLIIFELWKKEVDQYGKKKSIH